MIIVTIDNIEVEVEAKYDYEFEWHVEHPEERELKD